MLPKYKRILLKLSGEALMGDKSFGFDTDVIAQYARDIKSITDLGVQVAVVIGGGNIYRGMNEQETGIERAHGDYMGMLATVINGMALQAGLEKIGVYTRLQSAERQGSDLWGRNGQSLFYHGYRRLFTRH
jgi:uridylate kinase